MGSILDKMTEKLATAAKKKSERSPLTEAAQDILDAIEAKDAKALGLAIKLAMYECKGEDGDEDDE